MHFKAESAKYGLNLNLAKTKMLTNLAANEQAYGLDISGEKVEILEANAVEKYLGTKLCLNDCDDSELTFRIASAWAAFGKYRSELCNRSLSAKLRIRLFDSVVTPCALYASSCWALTSERVRRLWATWRKLLRSMFVSRSSRHLRHDGAKAWPDHMPLCTHRLRTWLRNMVP